MLRIVEKSYFVFLVMTVTYTAGCIMTSEKKMGQAPTEWDRLIVEADSVVDEHGRKSIQVEFPVKFASGLKGDRTYRIPCDGRWRTVNGSTSYLIYEPDNTENPIVIYWVISVRVVDYNSSANTATIDLSLTEASLKREDQSGRNQNNIHRLDIE